MAPSIIKFLDEAQEAHKGKDYDLALRRYTAALDLWRKSGQKSTDILSILDLRIATYVKLAELDLAREDAKTMIRTDRADGRGYLRCGQLDRLEENYEAALKWYDHGLKKIPATDKHYAYLQAQRQKTHDTAAAQRTRSKPADPAMTLPAEIFEMVVSYLNHRQLVAILRVSKNWNRLLLSLKPLVETIDFSDSNRPLTYQMIRASLRRLSEWPKTVIADKLTEPAASFLASHLGRWVNHRTLQRLEVYTSAANFTQLPFHRYSLSTVSYGKACPVNVATVNGILNSCKALRSAKFANMIPTMPYDSSVLSWQLLMPNLRVLQIEDLDVDVCTKLPLDMFQYVPNLERLTCCGVAVGSFDSMEQLDLSPLTYLQYLNFSRSIVPNWIVLPESIKAYHVADTCFGMGQAKPPQVLPNLRVVTVDSYESVPEVLLSARSHNGEGVLTDVTLDTKGWDSGTLLGLLQCDGRLKKLRSLDLTCQWLRDEHLEAFIAGMPVLEWLGLRHARISGVFLVGLLTAPSSRLSRISLSNCTHVSPDAIRWARTKGVVVEESKHCELSSSARRLRDLD